MEIAVLHCRRSNTMLKLTRRFLPLLALSLATLWIGACQPINRLGNVSGTGLAQVQKDHVVTEAELQAITTSLMGENKSIIMASDGAPYGIVNNGSGFSTQIGSGGVVTGLSGMLKYAPVTWVTRAKGGSEADYLTTQQFVSVATSGSTSPTQVVDPGYSHPHSLRLAYVHPSPQELDYYYENIANPFLWFVQHQIPLAGVPQDYKWQDGYKAVNEKFATAIADLATRDDTAKYIFLHDYQLYMLPGMLEEKLQNTGCACVKTLHFTHIPWPAATHWLTVANTSFLSNSGGTPTANNSRTWFQEILESMLATDVLGFQTIDDGYNFVETAKMFLGANNVSSVPADQGLKVSYKGHITRVDAFPISIDPDYIIGKYEEARAKRELPKDGSNESLTVYKKKISTTEYYRSIVNKLILRTERLDPAKGVYEGLEAYRELLEKKRANGTLYGQDENDGQYAVGMIAILVPTRENVAEYRAYKEDVFALVEEINQEFAEDITHAEGDATFFEVGHGWRPILYYNYNDWLYALYMMGLSDMLMATSRADGMNLVAKEFASISPYAAKNYSSFPGTLFLSDGLGVTKEFLNSRMNGFQFVGAPPDRKTSPPAYNRWVSKVANDLEMGLRLSIPDRQANADEAADFVRTNDLKKWLFRQLVAFQQVN
ncbi:MAG: trehalose-6-phosphate synthase [Myxococcales bacterium]|nr:MAG: trehalose-6-phosphate synthase [Myxococcales bacterium]